MQAKVDTQEFLTRSKEVIDRLVPKVPNAQEADYIRRAAFAGEPATALTDLTAILADDQILVTATDRNELRMLLSDLNQPVDDVDQLAVETPAS